MPRHLPARPSTLPALLPHAARVAPSRGVHVVEADGSITSCPYPELLDTARRIAGGLRASGVAPETPVLLPLSAPRAFVPAFWGTVLSGRVPVPLPTPDRPPAHDRLRAVAAALDAPAAIVADPDAIGDTLRPDGGPMFALEDLRSEDAAPAPPAPSPGDTALIQFSSGSTGAPKGVRLTHRNVHSNLRASAGALQLGEDDAFSNWMPLYHDMGLIGYHLVPLFVGIDQFHLPTAHFLRRPLRWLDHLTAQPVTVTAAPTFGQRLVLRRLEGRDAHRDWDLSDVRLLLNGAEPIDAAVMDRFAQALAAHGLARTAMHPVYGLAEATLAVTIPERPDDPPTVASWDRDAMRTDRQTRPAPTDAEDPRRSVAVGVPVDGCEVRVVDADDAPCPDGTLGHVQVRGDSIMPGYVDADSDSDSDDPEPFTPDGWLRTGDLGVLCDGRLHVTGRQRDRLIVRGQTLHALDLERAVARAVPGVRPGKVAVCGPEDDDTGDVVLFLAGRPTEAIAERFVAARRVLQRQYGLTPDALVPVSSRAFERTTSGKLRRYRLRAAYDNGAFEEAVAALRSLLRRQVEREAADATPPQTPYQTIVHRLWVRELGRAPETIGIHQHFRDDLGGTSVQAASILGRLESEHGLRVPSSALEDRGTIKELAAYIEAHASRLRSGGRRSAFGG